ncbi:MAG: sulfate ABC transporter substrate-binding protein [Planctomycetaceae bacterium]
MKCFSLVTLVSLLTLVGCSKGSDSNAPEGTPSVELLNVSYDPTRELWKDLNAEFEKVAVAQTGKAVTIKQSHGASGSQARAVIDGLEADVASLALWSDTEQLHKKGLLKDGWLDTFPNRSLPYTSTIVFVVRKGNPKGVKDWADLVRSDIQVITPNPKTSGNGKLAFLAAWGSVLKNGGSEEDARKFITQLYKQVPVLDTGARGATTTFAQKGIGDVHLTWESEAHLEIKEANGELELIFPSLSILAEPHIAMVDQVVDRKGTRDVVKKYLEFLYTPEGQEIIAKHYYRPTDAKVLEAHKASFPELKLFTVTDVVGGGWDEAQTKFFADGGEFDRIYEGGQGK